MSDNSKMLIGAMIALNLVLVGLLLFRERSIAPASAEGQPTMMAPAPVQVAAESEATSYPDVRPAGDTSTYLESPPAVHPADSELAPPEAIAPRRTNAVEAPEPAARVATYAEPHRRVDPPKAKSKPVEKDPAEIERRRIPATTLPVLTPVADAAPVPEARPRPRPITVSLAAGHNLAIRLDVGLHSRQVRAGDHFEASLIEDIEVDGVLLAAAGSAVTGRVVDVSKAGRVQGVERIRLTLSEVSLAGKTYPIEASVLELQADDGKERDVKVVGAATAVGAIIGGIAKGKKGAATGAATGAAAGTGIVLATRGDAVVLDSGTRLNFTLVERVRVTLPEGDVDPLPEIEPLPQPEPEAAPGVARR